MPLALIRSGVGLKDHRAEGALLMPSHFKFWGRKNLKKLLIDVQEELSNFFFSYIFFILKCRKNIFLVAMT